MTPIEPLTGPLTDGMVSVRMRREEDGEAIADASHDPVTRHWPDDEPMDEAALAWSMRRVREAWRTGKAAPIRVVEKCGFTPRPSGDPSKVRISRSAT